MVTALLSRAHHGSKTMIDADTPQPSEEPAPIGDPTPGPQQPEGDPPPSPAPTPQMDDEAAIEETEEQPS